MHSKNRFYSTKLCIAKTKRNGIKSVIVKEKNMAYVLIVVSLQCQTKLYVRNVPKKGRINIEKIERFSKRWDYARNVAKTNCLAVKKLALSV